MDTHSKQTRSFNMSQIRSKDTKPEMLVRRFLFSKGIRYRIHDKRLPGKPDLVFPKHRKIIFINGCFWHGHANCKYFSIPKTRTEWWLDKITNNRNKDSAYISILEAQGWKVLTIWECELKSTKMEHTFSSLLEEFCC